MGEFANAFEKFFAAVDRKATRVVQIAFRDMYDDMQTPLHEGGLVPVDTGLLRKSLVISINGVPMTLGDYAHQMIERTIKLGDRITSYRHDVDYAEKQEFGFFLDNGEWFHGRFYTTQATDGWTDTYIPRATTQAFGV